ncbi:hypothetical protein MBANPS3_012467 [Mucor bainieri]
MNFNCLSEEILERICQYINIQDSFALAKCSSKLYNQIAHFRYEGSYLYDVAKPHNQIKFLQHKVQNVSLVGSHVSYTNLYLVLNKFSYLKSVNITGLDSNLVKTDRLVRILGDTSKKIQLIVPFEMKPRFTQSIEFTKYSNVKITSGFKRPLSDSAEEIQMHEEELQRYAKRLKTNTDCEEIKRMLINTHGIADHEYKTAYRIASTNKNDIVALNEEVARFGKQFIESLLISQQGNWVLVTQVEVYCKKTKLDDCSNNMIISTSLLHNVAPVVEVNIKNEGNGGWLEMRIFYQDFEVLVTGGLYGKSSDSSGHDAFLGSSKVPFELMGNTRWIAHVPTEEAATVDEIRVLRNYMKQGSHHKWCFKSAHFANKNFETCRPLDLHLMPDLDNYYKLASFLISCAHNDSLTAPKNKDRMRQILNDARFWEDLAGASKNSTDADILVAAKRLQENLDLKKKEGKKLGKWKLWLIVAVLEFNTDDIKKELVSLYKYFLYQKCSQLNKANAQKLMQ